MKMVPLHPKTSTLYLFGFLCFWILSCTEASSSPEAQDSDKIEYLPGQPNSPLITQYSGYITVNEFHGRALFYWFFEAQSQPSIKPLVLWLNGGPGCSSIGYGAASELGPLRVKENGAGLDFNNYSWNKEANLLFVESPVGVGFSYTFSNSTILDDKSVAEDSYTFLVNWLYRFPQFKKNDFFIAGESYAGHYVPQLADILLERNMQYNGAPGQLINLKGFIVGNPSTDNYYDQRGYLEYAWSHAVISDEEYELAKRECDFWSYNLSAKCNDAMYTLWANYQEIDINNIFGPICLPMNSSSTAHINILDKERIYKRGRMKPMVHEAYGACYVSDAEDYFNRIDVQNALHVNITQQNFTWKGCSRSILGSYNYSVSSVLPVYKKLIEGGLRIWIYSGDADGNVPVLGTRYWIEALKLPLKSIWRPWFHKNQVTGWIVEYKGLTFMTVKGAGHLVPLYKPSEALALVHSFLSGEELPIKR
ncbi:unnamed protein product [Cuscuta europaea]|uniref:Carboxypeptidase n=1 Tax=Cuscuta europaea TaxID=41803 RepID=A0A9P0ZLF6_CUSEU|nr:unnamed protein product [Cuscuta europaea]